VGTSFGENNDRGYMMIYMKKKHSLKRMLAPVILISPALILIFIFHYMPLYGIIIAFKNFEPFKGIWGSEWAGLSHFRYFLTDDKFYSVFTNTLKINFLDISFGFTAPILFAVLANELFNKRFKKLVQTVSYLPHFLSWIVVSGIFYEILSPGETGMVNNFLASAFGSEPVFFMINPRIFISVLVYAEIWKSMGWSAILYFASIASINENLYEAAYIDGAGRCRQAIHITIPSIMPMIVLMFLLRVSSLFTIGFERIFLMQNPLVFDVSEVISTYVYRAGLVQMRFSLTTAIGLVQGIMGYILIYTTNKLSKRIVGLGLY
jgi:putative aldouronate transport system permease protein